jgi:hypothetical protein
MTESTVLNLKRTKQEDDFMPELRTYRIFISHAFTYNDEYYRLLGMLDNAPNFQYQNYSVPIHDPLHARSRGQLEQGLYDQIRPTNIVIVLAGMYVAHSGWIQKEIDIALEMDKPVLGIAPWGSLNIPVAVQDAADAMVGWNTSSIVNAIRDLAL